jgi:hypothetical protein
MKAEHRHQLHTNALADRVGQLLKGVRSAPKSTSTLIWVFVLLALGTVAVWQYAAKATVSERSALWTDVDLAARDVGAGPVALHAIEIRNHGTLPARAAQFLLARWNLQQGLGSLVGDDRVRALPLLSDARKLYGELAPQCVDVPLLAQEALLGRATAEESLAGIVEPAETTGTSATDGSEQTKEEKRAGSLNKALEYYEELAKRYPDTIAGKEAEKRAQQLQQRTSRSEIEQLYDEANKKIAPKVNIPVKSK